MISHLLGLTSVQLTSMAIILEVGGLLLFVLIANVIALRIFNKGKTS